MGLNSLAFIGELGRNLFFTYIRQTLAVILAALYGLLGLFLEIVFSVANLDSAPMFSKFYESIQDRFYVIIGVFMLFKVTMSLITYFANPDKITDKEMGAGKLVTRFITMLILLIIVPQYVFPFFSRIQVPLLSTLGKVVLNSSATLDATEAKSSGETIATTIFGGFFTKNDDCNDDVEVSSGIFDAASSMAEEACSDSKDVYKYKFNFVGAIICIIPILVLLIIIGIQVAIRAFKLILLKVIAPVPIISYMDPKSSKEGGRTSVYIKMFTTTYLDLFIHFGALYFAIEVTKLIFSSDAGQVAGNFLGLVGETKIFGMVFVVIGLLLFAFQAPKFVKKALGLKDSEFGSGLAGLLTTTAATAGMVGSGVAGFKAAAAGGGNFIQNFGSGISSAISGGRAGYKAAGDKSDYTKVLGSIRAKNAELAADRIAGVTASHRARELFYSTFTGQGAGETKRKNVEDWDALTKAHDDYAANEKKEATKGKYDAVSLGADSYIQSLGFGAKLEHYDSSKGQNVDYSSIVGKSKDLQGVLDQAKASGQSTFDFGGMSGISVSEGNYLVSELEKREQAVFRDQLQKGNTSYTDGNANLFAELNSIKDKIDKADLNGINGVDDTIIEGFKKMDDQMKLIKAASLETKSSAEYIAAVAASKKNK